MNKLVFLSVLLRCNWHTLCSFLNVFIRKHWITWIIWLIFVARCYSTLSLVFFSWARPVTVLFLELCDLLMWLKTILAGQGHSAEAGYTETALSHRTLLWMIAESQTVYSSTRALKGTSMLNPGDRSIHMPLPAQETKARSSWGSVQGYLLASYSCQYLWGH